MIAPTELHRRFMQDLAAMYARGLPPTVREMAARLGVSPSRVQERIDRLRCFDWVVRGIGKSRALAITELGWNIVDQLEGRATPGLFIPEQRCLKCGAAHFRGFGATCPVCMRWHTWRTS